MRSCGGSSMRRRCPNCSGARPPRRCSKPRPPTARVVFVELAGGDVRVVASAGCDADAARDASRAPAPHGQRLRPRHASSSSRSAATATARASRCVASPRPIGHPVDAAAADDRRRRAAGLRAVRRARPIRPAPVGPRSSARSSRCCPGSCRASAAMTRVVEQIQRLQGNDLTVLITGESGTGKELVARAIHVGSHRSAAMFLPYNCTTTGRELADSQLFGHRRGSFTGAVSDQPGLVRIGRRRHAVPRRDRRPAARRAAEAAAVPRAGRDHADRRDAAAARGRPRARRDQRRPRTARGRRQVPRGPVLPPERDPHPRAAAARAARRDPAPQHLLPARGVRAARASPTCS